MTRTPLVGPEVSLRPQASQCGDTVPPRENPRALAPAGQCGDLTSHQKGPLSPPALVGQHGDLECCQEGPAASASGSGKPEHIAHPCGGRLWSLQLLLGAAIPPPTHSHLPPGRAWGPDPAQANRCGDSVLPLKNHGVPPSSLSCWHGDPALHQEEPESLPGQPARDPAPYQKGLG